MLIIVKSSWCVTHTSDWQLALLQREQHSPTTSASVLNHAPRTPQHPHKSNQNYSQSCQKPFALSPSRTPFLYPCFGANFGAKNYACFGALAQFGAKITNHAPKRNAPILRSKHLYIHILYIHWSKMRVCAKLCTKLLQTY